MLIFQPLFTALTISCIGGAFSGIGIHQDRLSSAEQVHGMQVCWHRSPHLYTLMLNVEVLLLL
jgi:hypothetical protein